MRTTALLFGLCLPVFAADEQQGVLAVVQRLFDAMSAHDSAAAAAVLIPDGRVMSIRAQGQVADSAQSEFAANLGTAKQKYLERIWNPKILIRGGIAHVWAEYDFHLDGKFHHCGVDSFSLVKTPEGWKIAGIIYTAETTGCTASPLGPPPQ
jgi:hypothetical protein